MNQYDDPPPLRELEDSLQRLEQIMEWRRMGDRIRAARRERDSHETLVKILELQERTNPTVAEKRRRLLERLKAYRKTPPGA